MFVFKGCDGNANNFRTLQDCETTCQDGGRGKEIPADGYVQQSMEVISS